MSEATPIRQGFFAELRRRRVLRTLALYIVGAWGVMQVADVVFPALEIPEQAIRYLLMAAVLGFPVALVFAWLFNITPEGIRRTGRHAAGDEEPVETLQRKDYLVLSLLAVVLGLIVYGAIDRAADAPADVAAKSHTARAPRGEGPPMVAVLPFTFRGAGDDAAFFAGGVHDDLLTQLSQLSGIRVISRTSMLKYQDTTQSIPLIGRELGADVILEGGVQLAGEQIRINAQLIDARSDEHLWASTFNRRLTPENLFMVQAEIARAIATALDMKLSAGESSQLDVVPTDNLTAYREYHEAQAYMHKTLRPDPDRSAALLESALERDPNFVAAMVKLVYVLALTNFGGKDPAQTARVEELVTRIGKLAPNSVDYLIAQGFYVYYILRDYDAADRLMTQGRARAPSNMELVHIQSWIKKRQGDFDGWIDLTYLGQRLEPNETRWGALLAYRLGVAHRYEEALEQAEAIQSPDLSLAQRLSRLRIFRHHDLERARAEMLAVTDAAIEPPDLYATGYLLLTHLSVRDYPAAAELIAGLPDPLAEDLQGPRERIPPKFEWLLTLHLLSGDRAALDAALEATQTFMGLNGDEERWDEVFFGDRVLLSLAADDASEARAALDEMQQLISNDIAPMLQLRPVHCRGRALLGDRDAAVRCLRLGTDQPSEVMPFFEPLLPHYDGIRETPEFQDLLAEFTREGWLEPQAQ